MMQQAATQIVSAIPPCDHGDDLIGDMEAARLAIESKFLEAGGVLSEAVDGIGGLIAALDKLAEALGPAAIAATSEQLSHAAAKLSALPGKQADRRAVIGVLSQQKDLLAGRMDDMRRSLAYMRAFTMHIKITAGGIASADGEFGVFAQEISSRLEAGRGEVEALVGDLAKLSLELQSTRAQTDALDRRCVALIPSTPDQLLASTDLMGQHHGRLAAAMADAGGLAREIRKKVARILAALQVGDMTRQRIEHVQAGVALLDSLGLGLTPVCDAQLRALAHALLAAQLDATLDDFNREVAQIVDGLSGLARDAAALLRLRDLAYGGKTGDSGGFLRTLEQRVQDAVGLADEIEAADATAQGAGSVAGRAAQALSDRLTAIQSIKTDVTYMALNTALKSVRIGEAGRPLSTIASELRVQAGQLEATADACVGVLKVLASAATTLTRTAGEDEASGAGAALLAATARIKAASDLAENDVAALGRHGEAVVDLLTKSTAAMHMQTQIGDVLAQAAADLARRADAAEPCTDDIQASMIAFLTKMAATYTMVRERETQSAVCEAWGIELAQPPALCAAEAEADLDDGLF